MSRFHPTTVFRTANARYFGGRLPEPVIEFAAIPEDVLGDTDLIDGVFHIRLNYFTRKMSVIWIQTLLHEMVHMELWDRRIKYHGYVFQRRMRELVAQGAFNDLL